MSPFVDESWLVIISLFFSSGKICFARTFPNSTPNWSKLKMFHITPCTKILCSYIAINWPSVKGVILFMRKEFEGRLPEKSR